MLSLLAGGQLLALVLARGDGQVLQLGMLSCGNATATALTVTWAPVDATDLYYVALASSATARPAALQTATGTSLLFDDLYPDRDYWLTLRSHSSTEPVPEVWGWRPATGESLRCRTARENTAAPHHLRRRGESAHPTELSLTWAAAAAGGGGGQAGYSIGARRTRANPGGSTHSGQLQASSWRWTAAAAASTAGTLRELPPGTVWEVVVRDEATGAVSEPLTMRTAAAGSRHTVAWRASEYTFDVDFLQNHDAADARTLPIYLQYSGAINESCYSGDPTHPGSVQCNSNGPACIEKLSTLCAAERGNGFACMACADAHRAEIAAMCGNITNMDDVQDTGLWGEHWFCGTGWPGGSRT